MGIKAVLAGLTLALGLGASAQAATVTYQSAEADPKVQLTIDDSIAGRFRFTLSTVFGFADFLGLGFDFAGVSLAQANLSRVSFTSTHGNPNTPALVLFGNNTNAQVVCGTGCNFNGNSSSPDPYDYIIRIGENGGGKNNVASIVFDVFAAGSLAANPFSGIGVRAQGTSGPNDSIKFGLVPLPPTPPTPTVPVPAAGLLLLGALGGLAALRRRRAA